MEIPAGRITETKELANRGTEKKISAARVMEKKELASRGTTERCQQAE